MTRITLPLLAIASLGFAALVHLADAGDAKGFTKVFNGKDLTGWKIYLKDDKTNTDNIVVKDGEIQVNGDPFGYFYTDKSFKN